MISIYLSGRALRALPFRRLPVPSTASVGQRLSTVTGTANTGVNESEGLAGLTEKASQ